MNRIWKSLSRFFRRDLQSRFGQLLFVIHSVLVVYVFSERGSILDRPIHPHYESTLTNVLFLLDLPMLIVVSLILSPIEYLSLSPSYWWTSLLVHGITFIGASLQWWCLGYFIAGFFKSTYSRKQE